MTEMKIINAIIDMKQVFTGRLLCIISIKPIHLGKL